MTGADRPSAADGPWDPGLQPERTALAWQRTGLALAVASLVAMRDALVRPGPAGTVVAVCGAAAALLAGAYVLRRSRTGLDARVRALRAGLPLPPPVETRAAVVGVLCLGVAVLAVVLG